MTIIDTNNMSSLVESYLLSNTPNYLYEKLVSDPIVISISRNFSVQEILEELTELLSRDHNLDLEETVTGYSLLAAIITKIYINNENIDVNIDISKLEWGAHIVRIAETVSKPTTIHKISDIRTEVKILEQNKIDSSDHYQYLDNKFISTYKDRFQPSNTNANLFHKDFS